MAAEGWPFWLSGSIEITAQEQIAFLRDFYFEDTVFSTRTTDIVKDMIVVEETDEYRLSAKIGSCYTDYGAAVGWYVGYVERWDDVYFFATNLNAHGAARIEITRAILIQLGILPD